MHYSSTDPATDIADGISQIALDARLSIADCNSNGVPDECDLAVGTSQDEDENGVPDECQAFCELLPCGQQLSRQYERLRGTPERLKRRPRWRFVHVL